MDNLDNEHDSTYKVYDFGWYPEVIGVLAVGVTIWYLITFARGSM